MTRQQCGTCNTWTFIDYLTQYGDCKTCVAMKEKLGEEVYDWIMQLVDGKVDRAIEQHESRCEHERSSGYY
jgi:hypothetical protein